MYEDVGLFIDGRWSAGSSGRVADVLDPGNGQRLGSVAYAEADDLDRALDSAQTGFRLWRETSPLERQRVMFRAAAIMRGRQNILAEAITLEQGKPLAEARGEAAKAAEILEYFAGEATRLFGRIIPSRSGDTTQQVTREPVGPVAAFTPWNFPLNQVIRKVGPALATGCSIVVKASEETPATAALLVRAFHDAGLPAGVLNLVFGDPEFISQHLIASPVIKKVSFTGSTVVGKKLAALAGAHMKRVTMELGGHAPALIFNDADVERAAKILASNKYRNSGQSCISPTRILVEGGVYERFVSAFVREAGAIELGHGMDPATLMGPVITERRLRTLEALLSDAKVHGARVACGGQRLDRPGHFLQPTVLTDVPIDARILNEEPFGPVAVITPFTSVEDAVSEANRLPYGLAAYVFTTSLNTGQFLGSAIEAGMVSVNSHGLGHPETPFGGVKDSGYGSEGGLEALDNYLNFKFVSLARG